jgi:hypothetical protein
MRRSLVRSVRRLRRSLDRSVRRLQQAWHRRDLRLRTRRQQRSRPFAGSDYLDPSPGVTAFLAGESVRQVAYFVGDADPNIIDPRTDWPGAVADTQGVLREYIIRLQGRITELETASTSEAAEGRTP